MDGEKEVVASTEEAQKPESTLPSLAVQESRSKFQEQFDKAHEMEEIKDSQESDSDAPAVKTEQSDSSSVKEEIKGGTKKEEQVVDKTAELLQNKEKALHEEREKRKQANLKLRELQRQFDEKLKEMEEKLNTVVQPKSTEEESFESDDPDKTALLKRLKDLENKEKQEALRKQQEEAALKQKELLETISKTDKELKEEGFPGFKYGVARVEQVLRQMIEEGDILESEYLDPTQWKEVYRTKVYEEVASEFAAIQKKENLENRIANKKSASKVPGNPGAKPESKSVEDKEEPEIDDMSDYIKFRTKNSART